MDQCMLKLLGHTERKNNGRIVKQIYDSSKDKKSTVGRPNKNMVGRCKLNIEHEGYSD